MIVIGLEHLYICKQTARKNDRMGNGLFVARLFSPENGIDRSRGRNLGLEIGLNLDLVCFFFFFFIPFRGFYVSRIKVYRYWFDWSVD